MNDISNILFFKKNVFEMCELSREIKNENWRIFISEQCKKLVFIQE